MSDNNQNHPQNKLPSGLNDSGLVQAGGFDIADYSDELLNLEINEEDANEMLQTLWYIMRSFVELGFGVDSVSHLLALSAEQNTIDPSPRDDNSVKYTHSKINKNKSPASPDAASKESKHE